MAQHLSLPLTVAAFVLLLFQESQSEVTTVPLPFNLQCPSSQYFDYTGLVCSDCDSTKSCGCPSTSLQSSVECTIDQLWQGNCNEIACTDKCNLLSQVASLDQQTCTRCNTAGLNSTYASSEYDSTLLGCTCNNPAKGPPTRTHVMTKRLLEIYDESSGLPIKKDCFRCPEGAAVITKDLYEDGQQFVVTAGKKYIADPYLCASCPDPRMFFDTDYNCVCSDGYFLVGEASIGEQSCIQNNPSISSSYSRVRFQDPYILGFKEPYDFTLESITFSHLYLSAASECEYYKGSLQSCQALSNLCVLSMYDEDAPACKQLETISERRVETYHGQEDWKYTLPWLKYREDADVITNDRGIEMQTSFHPEVDHVNVLSFKLAKYTVNGTFVGMEDLANQFEFCFNSLGKVDQKQPHWLAFGMSYRHEYSCSVESLMGKEMFLYDLYLLDESSEACTGNAVQTDCLYPVPVLNRNLVKDSKFPNVNRQLDDSLDDVYTRRFFLFDNQSGRTSSGTEAIRYAKKIVLEVQSQSEYTKKLYPPRLVLEYAISANGSWSDEKEDVSSLVFKVEYSMKTENFWASIQIMIGFIFAFAVVIFGVRMNNWQSRQRANNDDPGSTGSILGLHFMLHAFMVACHTFVLLFFSFTFMICAYWFIFFKLQNEVFLLLPSDNEFYGATNEYYVFEVTFRVLFWCQTIYLAYTIIQQCRSDIIFVDWEQPRRGTPGNGVPMWRLVTVANEFNRMQSKRRSSIEFSLVFVCFAMLGLGQHQNALPQPFRQHNDNQNDSNIALSFANTVLYWALAAAIQHLWRFLFYERYIDEPPSTKFVDLCTVCNISVFLFPENHKGYYLHCKSPYSSADCSMEELLNSLQREGNGLTISRGLDGSTSACQTFDLFASPMFRRQLSKIYSYARPSRDRFFSQSNTEKTGGADAEKIALARTELTLFLQSFINQQPPPLGDGLGYIVREPWVAERILNVTPADFRTKTEPKCILHPDNCGFLSATFLGLGIEIDLLIHDILTYNAANMAFNNVGVSIFSVWAMAFLRFHLRAWYGKRNLSEKSLIDSRFLA